MAVKLNLNSAYEGYGPFAYHNARPNSTQSSSKANAKPQTIVKMPMQNPVQAKQQQLLQNALLNAINEKLDASKIVDGSRFNPKPQSSSSSTSSGSPARPQTADAHYVPSYGYKAQPSTPTPSKTTPTKTTPTKTTPTKTQPTKTNPTGGSSGSGSSGSSAPTTASTTAPTSATTATGVPISQDILNIAYAYPNKDFSEIYAAILAAMGDNASLQANIEAALKPLYQQSKDEIEAQRIARNADIDVDAASRGMGNSTWVTDAKLRQLRSAESNLANLDANYNNQLYSALADAIKDRDDTAYNNAMQWWNIQRQLAEEAAAAANSGGGQNVQKIPVLDPEKEDDGNHPPQTIMAPYIPSYAYRPQTTAQTTQSTPVNPQTVAAHYVPAYAYKKQYQ